MGRFQEHMSGIRFHDPRDGVKVFSTINRYKSEISDLFLKERGINKDNNDEQTILDLFNLSEYDITQDEYSFFLNLANVLGYENLIFDSKGRLTKETLEYINNILNESMEFYQNVLYRYIPKSFFNKKTLFDQNTNKFDIKNENALKLLFSSLKTDNKGEGTNKRILCSILKIAYVTSKIKQNQEVYDLDDNMKSLLEDTILQYFQSGNELDMSGSDYHSELEKTTFYTSADFANYTDNFKPVGFNLSARGKTYRSIKIKMLSQPEYHEFNAIKDNYGVRAEVKSKSDALSLLEYVYYNIFSGDGDIKQKNMLDEKLLHNVSGNISTEFYDKLNQILNEDSTTKTRNSSNFQDIKIVGNVNLKPVEFQIVVVGNKNEMGISDHRLMDCKRIIDVVCRLEGFISKDHIETIIYNYLISNPDLIDRFGEGNLDKAIKNLFKNITQKEEFLLELNIPKINRYLYTTVGVWNRCKYKSFPNGSQVKHPKLTRGKYSSKKI